MENSEEAGDDQGSGWLQVKKKHRSSSKFSLPSLVSEFSGTQTSETMGSHCPMSNKSRNFDGRRRSYYPNAGTKFAKNSQESAANSTTVPTENEVDVRYQDKCVVNQDNECSKQQTVRTGSATFNSRTGDIVEVPQMIQKIKWGDLEDDALLLNCGNPVGVESQFGGASNANVMVCREPENAGAIVSCDASGSEPQQNILLETSLNTNFNPNQMASLSCKDESFQDNSKEVNELSAEDMKNPLMECSLVDLSVNPSNPMAFHEDLELSNDQVLNSSPSGENAETPVVLSEVGDLEISELPALNGDSNAIEFAQESELLPSVKCEVETAGVSITSETLESSGYLKGNIVHDDLSKTQVRAGIAEGDANESKERFRERLWCFLFENLNRAVDELYLLCELECDLGQMKEAVLVLEEAACDFKDLNSRVEEFENMKRSSSQPKDGLPMTLKIDHRRPHALSWEVRRMTTSPHRAEILSSSLEAFKKIQQERASMSLARDVKTVGPEFRKDHDNVSGDTVKKSCRRGARVTNSKEPVNKSRKQGGGSDIAKGNVNGEKRNSESIRSIKIMQSARVPVADSSSARAAFKDNSSVSVAGKNKKENIGFTSEMEKLLPKKGEMLTESADEKNSKYVDRFKRQSPISGKDKEMRNATSQKSMDAWKEKRNWEDILASPFRVSARASYLPGMNRRSVERARILHDKLMSPDKKKKTALDLKKEADEKHARATRIRSELENERVQKLQRTSEKLNRVNEWQAVRSMKLREGMYARHQRSESRHEAFLAQVVRRAGDESSKVNEVRFITSLNEENKKLILRQKLHDSKLRRDEKLQFIKTKQKEDMAREEAVLERRKLIEAEKLQRLAEIQRKKEEAQARKEEERKASSAAREAKATEQLRRKQARAKAQQEEAELLAQKLAERLSESEQRRKFYLEQIRERASMDFRDQSSPLLRHSLNKENQARLTLANNGEDYQANNTLGLGSSTLATGNVSMQHPLKRRIKRIRQRLMALKHEYPEPLAGGENGGIGYRTALGTARAKIGRWLQELQRLRQARKEGAASIGLITAEMVKFFEGKEPELHASRQAGLLDFIASALPASHTSKPEACQVTIYLLRLLRVVLSIPANKNYFISQNLLPPIIPMLSASLENYIKMAASLHVAGGNNVSPSKTSENFESFSEVLNGFLWTVTAIIGHRSSDERQLNMQDGLLELVVVYQVIHRLRDLFALYDRPQVEGSPFPTSILLSIKLLTVLTSRPGSISSIDWESCPIIMERVSEIEEAKTAESAKSGNSSESNSSGDIAKCGAVSTFPDVPEDRPLGKLCKEDTNSELAFTEKGCVELNNTAIKSETENTDVANDQDDFKKKQTEDIARPLEAMKDEKTLRDIDAATKNENVILKQPIALLLSAISETGLVCLPSLLTAVLLQANNRLSSEQASYVLPSNFEEVATGVLKILNNLALVDLTLIQRMLARPDLKMELFHLMSFLLSHCTSKWTKATDQVGLLLLESLSLLSYFALFHPGNQAVLRWGKSPTILHKVCDLPFVFFSDPELMPALAGTLVAACYGCEQNKGLIQQEISVDMLLSLLRSCRSVSPTVKSNLAVENLPTDDSGECSRRSCSRYPARKVTSARGGALGNSSRACKARNQRENNSKGVKTFEVMGLKDDVVASNPFSLLMLHCRFPSSFVDKAEQFFSAET